MVYWQRFKTMEQRFAEKHTSEPGKCWRWTGAETLSPKFWDGARHRVASHVAHEIYIGPVPDGFHVLHTCDNRMCVNPDHLWLGTHDDNMADKKAKGRQHRPRGSLNGRAKLTLLDRAEIGQLRSAGVSQQRIADIYGVGQATISSLLRGETWQ